ncbi:MAG: thermonuclease family protein [Candidatus Omnitrophica bacterium]|nr:thermonuclease family protein [Candidatus Omnitrophota bacterium]
MARRSASRLPPIVRQTLRRAALAAAVIAAVVIGRHPQLATWAVGSSLPTQAVVRNVIDGDTIELATGQHVRYIGIDTPEVRRKTETGWRYEPQPYALAAKEFNQRYVEGKTIRLVYDVQTHDKYQRLLAYVYVPAPDGADTHADPEQGTHGGEWFVNAQLVWHGYAKLLTIPPNVQYTELFKRRQREAREAGRGLWSR